MKTYDGWALRRYWRDCARRARRRWLSGGDDRADLDMINAVTHADWLETQGRYQ